MSKPWKLPADWNARSDLRTRVSYQKSQGQNFVVNPLALTGESRLTDNGRRAVSMSADTDVAENLSSSFVISRVESFDRNLNRRFTQTVLSAVMHLQFYAGSSSEIDVDTATGVVVLACNSDAKEGAPLSAGYVRCYDRGEHGRHFYRLRRERGLQLRKGAVRFWSSRSRHTRGEAGWGLDHPAMRARADTVIVQSFTHTTADGKKLPMRNILRGSDPS